MSDLNGTYGALFIGVLVSAVLFGVAMLQVFVYFQQYPSDRAWRKLAVTWLWLLDALHLAFSAHFVYYYLVVNFNDPSALSRITLSYKLRTVVDGLVVVSVHTFYMLRLWTLLAIDDHVEPFGKEDRRWSAQKVTFSMCASRWMMRKIVPWLVSALVLIGYAIAFVMCFETFKFDTFERLTEAPFATYVPLVCSTVIDVVIAGSLCYFLARCRTEFGAMNGPLTTLMVYTLNTGIITAVCSLLAISMMVSYPSTFITIAIQFLAIKLYINSYLAMLNARGGLHQYTRRARPGFTPNASIALGDIEHKPSPFFVFPQSVSSVHLDQPSGPGSVAIDTAVPDARTSHSHEVVVELSRGQSESDLYRGSLRAPRLSHPDVYSQYDTLESAIVRVQFSTLARQLALTPPPVETEMEGVSPKTRPKDLANSNLTSTSSVLPTSMPHPQDYPSPPERVLSPLRFGSPPTIGVEENNLANWKWNVDCEAPPIVYAPRDKEKYMRMVRTARSRSKARRALFEDGGIAVMWGL